MTNENNNTKKSAEVGLFKHVETGDLFWKLLTSTN